MFEFVLCQMAKSNKNNHIVKVLNGTKLLRGFITEEHMSNYILNLLTIDCMASSQQQKAVCTKHEFGQENIC